MHHTTYEYYISPFNSKKKKKKWLLVSVQTQNDYNF